MKLDFLPKKYKLGLESLDVSYLYEIRMRTSYPVLIRYKNEQLYLSNSGATILKCNAIICKKSDIDEIIALVTKSSLYAYNDRIKEGYLTTDEGVRIGLAGECVCANGNIHTIKNFTSLNIRVPHEIFGAANDIFCFVYNKKIKNTLIISPPARGKTTILKDLARKIDDLNIGSIMVIDERAEFQIVKGANIDTIMYSDKLYAFEYGLRSLSPNIVITDELSSEDDWICAERAVISGVKLIASCHGASIDDIRAKEYFQNIFDVYVVLDDDGVPGRIKGVYNREFISI